jgi:hypothetical protein
LHFKRHLSDSFGQVPFLRLQHSHKFALDDGSIPLQTSDVWQDKVQKEMSLQPFAASSFPRASYRPASTAAPQTLLIETAFDVEKPAALRGRNHQRVDNRTLANMSPLRGSPPTAPASASGLVS